METTDLHQHETRPPTHPKWGTVESPYTAQQDWTEQRRDAVMFGDEICPYCSGTMRVTVIDQLQDTDLKRKRETRCVCYEGLYRKRQYLERILPRRYQRMNLRTMKPSPASKMSLERQAKVLSYIIKNREDGFFFYGAPGTGKTTFATALVRYALERDWKQHFVHPNLGILDFNKSLWIRYINWDTHIQQLLDYQNHPDTAPEPTINMTLLREASRKGRRPVIVLEEVDKSRLTEFKANKLFELVCFADETKAQLIITTNHRTEDSFQSWLYKTDNEAVNITGEAIWRRIVDNCKLVEFKVG